MRSARDAGRSESRSKLKFRPDARRGITAERPAERESH